ncbi:phosphoglycerate mutase [Mycena belliarum]|uniref:Phosphoglycerate mutase n=1 Tax=Mycena belliarum TaxID=1033014 RepID=A0AAD6UGB9_9AGAR|nr:phosphoglycerate mutase [Mycena belliae]
MLTVTFIRHGQSEDNKKTIWAGWKDTPLSELGNRQAAALGEAFSKSNTNFDFIYASDLLRAHSTGQAVLAAHQSPKPPFTADMRFREQHFGIGEGQPWVIETPPNETLEDLYKRGIFPILRSRDGKFPEGESLDDLARRAEQAIAEFVVPHLAAGKDLHIAIASHGLCISELVAALLRLDPHAPRDKSYTGLLNTAWARAVVSVKDETATGPLDITHLPPLTVEITDFNNADHLAHIEPEVLDEVLDEEKSKARAFFAGKAVA